jgi:hypothetical protein
MGLFTWIAYLRAKRALGRMVRVPGLVDDVEVVANEGGDGHVYRVVNVRFQESEGSTTLDCWFGTEDDDWAVGDSVPVLYEPGRVEWAVAEPYSYPYNEVAALGCVTVLVLLGGGILSLLF